MFVVTVSFRVKPGHEAAFLDRVKQQAADSLAREPDCLQFDVYHPAEGAGTVFLYEIYRDEAAFEAHLETSHFREFDAEAGSWLADKEVQTWLRAEPGPQ